MWERDVIRVHCVPNNPQSEDQQINRFRFRFVSRVGVGSLVQVVRPYWNMFNEYEIGFNSFVKLNMNQVGHELDFENISMTVGNYEPVFSINFIRHSGPLNRTTFKWSSTVIADGSPDDTMLLILIDWHNYIIDQGIFFVNCMINTDKTRKENTGFIICGPDCNVDYMEGYISVLAPGFSNINEISISKWKDVT